MKNEELASVRKRLENLKENPRPVPKPLDILPGRERRLIGEGMLTFERVFQQKVEKAIKKIESVNEKMKTSSMFMNYFYDLKKAEQEFLDLLSEAEKRNVEFTNSFLKKIESIKGKIRHKIK